ncbi:LamG-like jellyroll fold domain-containing protein [Streptosporangium canum]|uniref:LamG-like jellyroll fold domain-containing protein n=1 Tax=Streptosporangium canum TaxID=324952 RepID=UPI0037BB1F28
MPGLLLFQALPVTAAVQAATSVQGPLDSPKQLTGSAQGLPSLVESSATATTAKRGAPDHGGSTPKRAVAADARSYGDKSLSLATQAESATTERAGKAKARSSSTTPLVAGSVCTMEPCIRLFNVYPPNEALVGTLTPLMTASARIYGWWDGNSARDYSFTVRCDIKTPQDMNKTPCAQSGWLSAKGSWPTPAGLLQWGKQYCVTSGARWYDGTQDSATSCFITGVRQPVVTSSLGTPGANGQEFHQFAGNYTTTVTDAAVSTVGPGLAVTRTYNTLDPRQNGIFGVGWSTRWDMRIQREPGGGAQTLLVTYPQGQVLRFIAKGDGTFQPPPGMFATLAEVSSGGWRLMDKSSTTYLFDDQGRLTKVTDSRGRVQDLVYAADGKLSKVTATGGRSLTFTWAGAHVASVFTDPVDGAPLTWTYHYDGDKLIKACSPAQAPNCTTYAYTTGSRYKDRVLDTDPVGYWRLGEGGSGFTWVRPASCTYDPEAAACQPPAAEAAQDLTGVSGAAIYYRVGMRGRTGPLAATANTAVRLDGNIESSSYVILPRNALAAKHVRMSTEMWFKTTQSGVLMSAANTRDRYGYSGGTPVEEPVPALLYVGTDGRLRGQLYRGATPSNVMTPTAVVNDGQWHHVVLTGDGPIESLYLDGQKVATRTGSQPAPDLWLEYARIGTGQFLTDWPAAPPRGQYLYSTFNYNGEVDEVAIYDKALSAEQIADHYAARAAAPHLLEKITLPSGRVWMNNTYNPATDRLKTHTDHNGGKWTLSEPVYTPASGVSTITVTDPKNGSIKYGHDAWRGNRLVWQIDQLGKKTSYAYDTAGFLSKVTDPNGNISEQAHDERGNTISAKTCREAGNCQTSYSAYYLNNDDPFDARNDRPLTFRDARSSSPTDNTYATTTEYTTHGEPVKQITPATPDFPDGRSVTSTYTDGTEPAIGGGTTPAGLVKSQKNAKGNESTYRYNAAGDLAEQISPAGLKLTFAYDALGRVTSRTEISTAHPSGITSTFTYDGLGRMLTQTGVGVKNEVTNVTHTAKTTLTYDADGNTLTTTVADLTGGDPEHTTVYTYDSQGRVETVTDPEGGMVRSTRDATGALVSTTDPMGTVLTYAYTKRGELFTTTLKNWTGSPVSPQAPQDVVLELRSYDPAGRLATQADAMGRKTSYTYFTDNRLSQVIADDVRLNGSDTTTDVVLQDNTYDPAGNLTKQVIDVDKDKKAITDYVYDAAGRLTSTMFDPTTLKRKTAYTYDAAGNVTKKDLTGAGSTRIESTLYAYNTLGQVTRQTVENGADDLISTSTYDDRGLLTAITDPRGNAPGATAADFTTTMRYNAAGQLVETKAPQVKIDKNGSAADGRPTVKYGYDTAGLATHTVDAEGRTLTSVFDKAGRLTSATSSAYTPPGGSALIPKVSFGYDAAGRQTKVTDQRNFVTSTDYDALGRPVRVTDPGPSGPGGQWVAEYDLLGEQLAVIDPTGARAEATYDELGRKITATQIERKPTTAAHTTTMTYDSAGNLLTSVAPGAKTTSYTVNVAGQVTTVTDPNNKKSTADYDFLGREAKVTDPLKNVTEAEYDLAGRKIGAKDLDATGAVVRTFGFGYDLAGNQTSATSGEGHVTRQTFDALGRTTSLIEPVTADKTITTTFGYDAVGARTRLTDGRGNATWTGYNTLGLAESVIEPSTTAHPAAADRTWTTVYDAAGNAVATLQPGGVRIDRTFDPLGQMTKQTGTGASVATPERTVSYDDAGRVTAIGDYTLDYNDRSLLTKVSKATNQIAAYAYDALGNPTQRVDTAGTATYTYDNANNLKTATDPVTGRTWTYGYDDADRLTSQTSANPAGSQLYTYDAVDRLASHTLKNSAGTELSKIAYGWDKDDNLTTKTTSGTAGAGANTYGYDRSGRLTSWTAPGGAVTPYEWDDSGNRTKAGSKTFVYDERNRLTSGAGVDYTYTPRGTLATEVKDGVTRNLTFDAFDRMIADGEASYGYDALGRMMSRTKGADQQRFVYSGLENEIVAVTDAAGAVQAKYGRDLSGGLLSLQEGGGPALGAMTDLHGDVVGTFSGTALVDSTAYDPFGEVTHRSGTQRMLGYQGEYTDPDTGKVNMDSRWYQPGTGAFTSRDTATLNPNPSVQANRYTYANAGPLTGADPTGHSTVIQTGGPQKGASGGSDWQSYNWADAWKPRNSSWSFIEPEVIPGKPYYAWPDQPCECLPIGTPLPKDFWKGSAEEQELFMAQWNPFATEEERASLWALILLSGRLNGSAGGAAGASASGSAKNGKSNSCAEGDWTGFSVKCKKAYQSNCKDPGSNKCDKYLESLIKNLPAWAADLHHDFVKALLFISYEMVTNLESAQYKEIRKLRKEGKNALALKKLYDVFKAGGRWDHKPYLMKLLKMKTGLKNPDGSPKIKNGGYICIYKNCKGGQVYYDVFSNIHYGFIMKSLWYNNDFTRLAPRIYSWFSETYDGIGDELTASFGWNLYKAQPNGLAGAKAMRPYDLWINMSNSLFDTLVVYATPQFKM